MQNIGILWGGDLSDVSLFRDAFREELRDRGLVEGRDITIAERYIKASAKPLADLASELAAMDVHVIVAVGTPAAQAARNATEGKDISVVFAAVGDPRQVITENVTNVTGVRLLEPASSGERLRKLKEAIPSIKRVAALWNQTNPVHQLYLQEIARVASQLGITLEPIGVQSPAELEDALNTLKAKSPDALVVLPDPMLAGQRAKIMRFAVENRVPAIYSFSRYVEEGGLMSYGPNYVDMFRQAAALVNSILRQPSQLPPIEQVRSSEIVINLSTARRIGCDISESVRAQATLIN
jgi:putative tryptophan/tyrosine transport system substrate-binding protein